ncbi:BnaC03g30310D [Brassica napus]|uniref:BnaC03g30310D protein n=1 Tax=Brassica napus TaxID=3708 RepID=A0A078FXR7_BRANA|nr:BnaC03g30310D [Brassica napus]
MHADIKIKQYLRGYLHGSCDKELFKKNVPVVSYDDVKPYIERVVNGEPSNVISGKPITRFLLSSGTTAGKQKIFPVNNKFFEDMSFVIALGSFLISKYEMLNRTKPAEHNQTEIKLLLHISIFNFSISGHLCHNSSRRVSWSSSVTAGEPPSSSVAKLHVRLLLRREINTNKFFLHVVLFISSPLCSWWL